MKVFTARDQARIDCDYMVIISALVPGSVPLAPAKDGSAPPIRPATSTHRQKGQSRIFCEYMVIISVLASGSVPLAPAQDGCAPPVHPATSTQFASVVAGFKPDLGTAGRYRCSYQRRNPTRRRGVVGLRRQKDVG